MTTTANTADSIEENVVQVQTALDFNTELVGASHKSLLNSIAATKGDMLIVALEDIRIIPGFNVRVKDAGYHAHIRDLANSIRENGFYNNKPLTGYAGMEGKKPVIFLTDGHCRMEGAHLAISEGAPITELPVILKDKSVTMEDLTVELVRSNNGKRLTPLEMAIACKRLVSFNLKPQTIADKIGITVEYVNQLLTIAGAPASIREMIQAGEATAAVALGALRDHGSDAGKVMGEALAKAKASGKTKLTQKFLPQQILKKAYAKSAPAMYTAITQVKAHDAFGQLPEDLRKMIEDIISKMPAAEEAKAKA